MFKKNKIFQKIADVDLDQIDHIANTVLADLDPFWKNRSINIMSKSKVLKGISPTQIDRLEKEQELIVQQLCVPLLGPFLSDDHVIVYLDISNLPSGQKVNIHFDYAWIHLLSRRIHIPIKTNGDVKFAAMDSNGVIQPYQLSLGGIYEINNMILHAVYNGGNTDRWHIIADIINKKDLHFLESTGKTQISFLPACINDHYSEKVTDAFDLALNYKA
jgi:hypothetical protein